MNFSSHCVHSVQMVIGGGEPGPCSLRSDVMERLHQLEEQLNAIESNAKTVEGEFKTTNQVKQCYTTIGQLFIAWFNDCILGKSRQIVNPIIVKVDPVLY